MIFEPPVSSRQNHKTITMVKSASSTSSNEKEEEAAACQRAATSRILAAIQVQKNAAAGRCRGCK